MSDPLANLKAFDPASLPDVSLYTADMPTHDEWAAEVPQPFDDVPDFDPEADPEVNVNRQLSGDKTYTRLPVRRLFIDYRENPEAYRHIAHLPAEGEDVEMLISGRYAMWELVPSLIVKTGQNIDTLTIATLSYSKQNAAELLGLLDDGRIGRCGLLVSYFFKAQNRPLYDSLVPGLRERGCKVLAMRTHAKVFLVKMVDGTCYVIRGSPNMRSSKNFEQLTMSRDAGLYEFYAKWIEGELLHGVELGKDADEETDRDKATDTAP